MKTKVGDLIQDCKSGIILHQVNCQGVMGKGIALQIRNTYTEVYKQYKKFVESHDDQLSKNMLGTIQPVRVSDSLIVINLFGQDYYANNHGEDKRYTSYDALDECFDKVKFYTIRNNLALDSIHHPMIGCGLAGGNWNVVGAVIDLHFGGHSTCWILPKKKE